MRDASEHALSLARALQSEAARRHAASQPWRQDCGRVAFDAALCDGGCAPAGHTARVVVRVVSSSGVDGRWSA